MTLFGICGNGFENTLDDAVQIGDPAEDNDQVVLVVRFLVVAISLALPCHPSTMAADSTAADSTDRGEETTPVAERAAALALRDRADARAACIAALSAANADQGPVKLYGITAKTLLGNASRLDASNVRELAAKHLGGEDSVAVLAMASHRAGGDAWRTFRIEMPNIARKVPLSGDVIVFINRLAEERITVAVRSSR